MEEILKYLVIGLILYVIGSSIFSRDAKRDKAKTEAADKDALTRKANDLKASLEATSVHRPLLALLIGGSGLSQKPGAVVYLSSTEQVVRITNAVEDGEIEIPIENLTSIDVSGPGAQTSNAGLMGGGFGVEGALKGILAASLINAATTKTRTDTFLRVATGSMEAYLHLNNIEPSELRLVLSPLFVAMEAKKAAPQQASNLAAEIGQLKSLHASGALSDEEFASAKKKLLGPV